MTIVLIFLFMFLLSILTNSKTRSNSTTYCNYHKWIYKGEGETEYMVCENCGKLPGADNGEQL